MQNSKLTKKIVATATTIIDLLLIILSLGLAAEMVLKLISIAKLIADNSETLLVIDEVLLFFLLFEFIVMVFTYIQESHHIPVNMLIYITITSILRHTIGNPSSALDTLLTAIAILVLVASIVLLKRFNK